MAVITFEQLAQSSAVRRNARSINQTVTHTNANPRYIHKLDKTMGQSEARCGTAHIFLFKSD